MNPGPFKSFTSSLYLLGMMMLIFASRLLPHPPNVSPVLALLLFSAQVLPSRALGIIVPLAAIGLSDLFLGGYPGISFVYGSFFLVGALALFVFPVARRSLRVALPMSLAGSTLFFLITNLGMWRYSGFYPMTTLGLATCFTAALPFFRNALLGDLFFTLVFFGSFEMVKGWKPASLSPSKSDPRSSANASE